MQFDADNIIWFNSCLMEIEVDRHVIETHKGRGKQMSAQRRRRRRRLLTQRSCHRLGRRLTRSSEQKRWKVAAMRHRCLDEQTESDQRRGDFILNFTPCCWTIKGPPLRIYLKLLAGYFLLPWSRDANNMLEKNHPHLLCPGFSISFKTPLL